jgi:hypothetical protein
MLFPLQLHPMAASQHVCRPVDLASVQGSTTSIVTPATVPAAAPLSLAVAILLADPGVAARVAGATGRAAMRAGTVA